jgi:hypothetical protein
MSNTIFTRGKLNEVFFKYGVWSNQNKRHRFVHAPFDRVEIDGETYLNTRSIAAANGSSGALIPYIATVDAGDNEDCVSERDFFFTELNPVTMEECQMGDWVGRGEDWVGVHQFRFI